MNNALTTVSAAATGTSIAAFLTGDELTAWVLTLINVATLITNAAIAIYRKIRDRDKDLEKKKKEEEDVDEIFPRK